MSVGWILLLILVAVSVITVAGEIRNWPGWVEFALCFVVALLIGAIL